MGKKIKETASLHVQRKRKIEHACKGKKAKSIAIEDNVRKNIIEKATCSICYQFIVFPYETHCRHIFCFLCIKYAVQLNQKCPICRAFVGRSSVDLPNENIMAVITDHILINASPEEQQSYNIRVQYFSRQAEKRSYPVKRLFIGLRVDFQYSGRWRQGEIVNITKEKGSQVMVQVRSIFRKQITCMFNALSFQMAKFLLHTKGSDQDGKRKNMDWQENRGYARKITKISMLKLKKEQKLKLINQVKKKQIELERKNGKFM